MKVLITTSTLPVSDTDKVPAFVKDQARALKKNYPDLDIIVHAPHNAHSKTSSQHLGNGSYREVRFHYFLPYRWELLTGRGIMPALKQNKLLYLQIPFLTLFQFTSLWSLVRKEKPDVLYAHWFTPQAITAALVAKLTHTPLIFTTHASDVAVLHKVPFSKALVRWVCRTAQAFTAVSDRTATKLTAFFGTEGWRLNYADKLSIIPMGVDINPSALKASTIARTRDLLNIPENKKYLLFLGRLAEKKGVSYLLEAFSKLPAKTAQDLHLIIAGDGQLKPSLEKHAAKLGIKNITFTGYVHGEQKDALLALADYLCLPSIVDEKGDSEGLPVVFMEGLAARKIVLASDASSGEAFIKTGVSGFVFAEKSAGALAQAITDAVSLTPKQLTAMQAQAAVLAKQFDWDTIAQKHYQLLEKAAQS